MRDVTDPTFCTDEDGHRRSYLLPSDNELKGCESVQETTHSHFLSVAQYLSSMNLKTI